MPRDRRLRSVSRPLQGARRESGGDAGRLGAALPSRSARSDAGRYAACVRAEPAWTRRIAHQDSRDRGIDHLVSSLVSADLESARLEWEHAYNDLAAAAKDPSVEERVRRQLEAITTELRRRIGGTFTIGELAEEYAGADVWARDVLSEQGTPGWPRTLSLVEGAAFHLYARGAVDYRP